ncbi:MAG TPA: SDR family oxidoreductase [Fibrobacteria bacterium]|nr:SDR family oxidoreductase [Fibrobacteria bacterium]
MKAPRASGRAGGGKRRAPAVRTPAAATGASAGAPRTALVTGSAKRLGRALALRLASLGYHVWIHYLTSRAEAESVLAEVRAAGGSGSLVKGDIGTDKGVETVAARVAGASDRLDVLVHNVGIYRTGHLLDYPVEDFRDTLQANLTGPFHLTRLLLPLFPAEGGSIVNIGYAGVENLTASLHNTAYLISKTGLYTLTRSLAQALGPRNIRVNMVSPGILDNSVELPRRPADQVPLGRLGTCADVCDAVEYLVGARAGYVTGVNLDVAGGYMLRLKGLESDGA